MNVTDQTLQTIDRVLRKAASKFTNDAENMPLTDIYLQVKQESGEILVFDDDETELTRCVVEEWIGNADEDFYTAVQPVLREGIRRNREILDNLPVLKPYSFVLIDEDRETVAELHLVDDDLLLLDGNLMEGLNEDLESFLDNLMQK